MKSPIKEIYSHLIPSWVTQQPVMDDDWSRELFAIETEERNTRNIVFSPDGKTGASSSYWDGKNYLKLWNAQTGKVKYQTTIGGYFGVEFSRDGSLIAHGTEDGRVRLWNLETDEEYFLGEVGENEISRIAFSPVSDSLIFSRADHSVEVWNYGHCQQIYAPFTQFRDNYDSLDTCAVGFLFNDEAVVLYSGYFEHTWEIYLLNEAGTELECIVEGEAPAYTRTNFCVSRNGCRVLVSNQHMVKIWDAKTGRLSPELLACDETQTGDRDIHTTALSSDGRFFATSSLDNTVRVWDSFTHTQILSFRYDQDDIETSALSHDGSLLALGSFDGTLRLWDIAVDRSHTEITNPKARLTYPFGIEVITNTEGATTMLRKEDTGSCRFYTEDFKSLHLLMQGNLIALILRAKTLNKLTAHFLSMDLEKQSPGFYFGDNRDVIVSSSNGEKVAVLGEEHVWVLDAKMSEELSIPLPKRIYDLQFSPDSRFIGMIFSRGVDIWDLENKNKITLRTGLPCTPAIGFSPKSDAVAILVRDHSFKPRCCLLEVWQISRHPSQQLNERTPPSNNLQTIGSVIYSAGGNYIVMQTLQRSDTASHNSLRGTLVLVTYNLATGLIQNIPCTVGQFVSHGPMAAWSDLIAIALILSTEKPVIAVIDCNTGERICTFDTSVFHKGLVEEMSFSSDGRYLNLDRGQILIPVYNCSPTAEMYSPSSLWIGEEWIFQRGRKLLWIPPEFRNRRMSVQFDAIWVYPRFGVVGPIVFFKLDLAKTPFAAEVPPEGEGFRYDEQERVMYLR